jgi:riboflavin synthase
MFTGIIEQTGTVTKITGQGTNKTFWISSPLSSQLKIDQSLSHNGVCLTVEEVNGDTHRVTAIAETLIKTNLNTWKVDTQVNLERCMQMNGRLDGHIVQGHVDATAICTQVIARMGSWEYSFEFDEQFAGLVIEKGSVCVNGVSLTLFNIGKNIFTVAIIPYTYEHTNMQYLQMGSIVNIEFDVLGKFIQRQLSLQYTK